MMGTKNVDQMRENLTLLDSGPMAPEELERMNMIGDMVYKKKKG